MTRPYVRRITIRGKRWRIVVGKPPANRCDGLCCYKTRTIYVRRKIANRIPALIHEVLHACFPDMDEESITEAEISLVTALGVFDIKKLK